MRRWINLMEALHGIPTSRDVSEPYIRATVNGERAHIGMLYVPTSMRGTGVGRKTYQEWEAKLPSTVRVIELEAVDYGDGFGDADKFWSAMGFIPKYEGRNLSDEAEDAMWKGINGHEVSVIDLDSDPDNIEDQITECIANCGFAVEGVWLYGSQQTGNPRPDSDWDILVVIRSGKPEILQDELHDSIYHFTDANVDFTVVKREQLKDKSSVAYHAFTTGRRLV